MDAIYIAAIVALLGTIIILILKRPGKISQTDLDNLKIENDNLKIKLARAEERSDNFLREKETLSKYHQEERTRLLDELAFERSQLAQANQSLESARSYYKAQQEKLAEQKQEIEQTKLHFQREFENVAEKLLKEKSREFSDVNKVNISAILDPLKQNLKSFEEKVDKVYNTEAAERNVLRGEIGKLMELNQLISTEASNLTKALKGDNKKQGNWGEVILEKVLERSGLVRDREYRMQASLNHSEGNRLQPDVIIDLPDDKHLVIDSKVSLVAYDRLVNCETEEERKLYSKAHIESIRGHVHGLSSKNYHDLHQINSPDFVLLFVPIESSFSFAVQLDTDLFADAWEKRVVIVSPSTLLATLRTIASIWKQERQNRNVLEIARLSGEMYDKFVAFVNDMESIGKNIRQSQDAYDKAFNKLSSGRGNLAITAEKVKNLGAKANKQLEPKYIDTQTHEGA